MPASSSTAAEGHAVMRGQTKHRRQAFGRKHCPEHAEIKFLLLCINFCFMLAIGIGPDPLLLLEDTHSFSGE